MRQYSKEKIKKEVLKASIESPISLFSFGIGVLAGIASFLFDGGFLLQTLTYGGLLFGVSSFVFNYFIRKDQLAKEYLQNLEKEFLAQNDRMLAKIKQEFMETKLTSDTESYGEQGLDQFQQIQNKFQKISEILEKKFNPGELTHRRFLGTAEQVYLTVLDNLDEIANMLNTTEAIDSSYIEKRLQHYREKQNINSDDEKEIETLKERKNIKAKQIDHINRLLAKNEEAMTKLDATMTSIASVKTKQSGANQDIEQTMEQLERLAQSAKKYEI